MPAAPDAPRCPVSTRGLLLRPSCAECHGEPPSGQHEIPKGAMVYLQGDAADAVYALCRGVLRESRTTEEGQIQGIRLIQPGDLFGVEALLGSGAHYRSTVEALADASACRVSRDAVSYAFTQTPVLGPAMAKALAGQLTEMRDSLVRVGAMTAEERVRDLLQHLLGDATPGKWVRLALTREEIARHLSLAPETVSRVVQSLARDGDYQVRGRWFRQPVR